MAYSYQDQRANIFTPDGMQLFLKIRDRVQQLLKESGAVRLQEAIQTVSGDTWDMLACIDHLVALGELRELTPPGSIGQHRVFVSTRS